MLGFSTAVISVVLSLAAANAAVFVPQVPTPSWRVNGTVYAVATVGDVTYVGGQFTTAISTSGQSVARRNMAAFSADTGELVTTWRSETAGVVRALVSDGSSLWVGGTFTSVAGRTHNRVAKVSLQTGAPDAGFSASSDGQVRALEVSDGDLYVGGTFTTMNGAAAGNIAKVNAQTGQSVAGFTAWANNNVRAVAKNPVTDVLYVGGDFSGLGGAARNGIGAVSSVTGATTPLVFGNAVRPMLGLDTNADGSRLYGAGGGGTNAVVAWNTTTGVRMWRQVTMGDIQAVRYFNDMVYFGFHDGFQQDTTIKFLAVDAQSGLVDQTFKPTFDHFWGVYAIDVSGKGVVIGGDFTTISGVPAQGWARFHNDGPPPPPPPTTERYLGSASTWRYWDRGTRPAGWQTTGFDDSGWSSGGPQLGYGDGDETTVISYGPSSTQRFLTSYYRTTFTVNEMPESLKLGLLADDGAAVYINGVEVVRDNLPTVTLSNTTRAIAGRSGGDENAMRPFDVPASVLHAGVNNIAVEVHQDTPSSSDSSFDADLFGQMAPAPSP